MTATNEVQTPVGAQHLPKGVAERRTLERAGKLDVGFDVTTAGLVIVVAAAGDWKENELLPRPREGERVGHRVDLIAPGGETVATTQTSESSESHLVYEVPASGFVPGRWTARLTNLASGDEEFGMFVSSPGVRELHAVDFPADAFAGLARLKLELHRGHHASCLTVETSAGPITHYFTVDDMEYSCPWMPRVVAYFDTLQSTSVEVSVPAGSTDPVLRYELGFADDGIEINGTLPLDLRRIQLKIDLPIVVSYHHAAGSKTLAAVEYEEAQMRVEFSFEPQFEQLVEWFPGFFPRWRRLIQHTVERACRQLFATTEIRQLFSEEMQACVLAQIGDAKPVGVAAADGKLRFSYYTI